MDLTARLQCIDSVLADPPLVHRGQTGAWNTARSAYEFLARKCEGSQTRTLETGLGVSTVLFAMWGTDHTCVVWNQSEADVCRSHLEARGIDHGRVEFLVGSSTQVLPTFTPNRALDLFLIDGGHHFPVPIIDWYFGARHLRSGGTLLLDDVNLASVRLGLGSYLRRSPNWRRSERTLKWQAWELVRQYGVGIDDQPFIRGAVPDVLALESRLPSAVKPTLKRIVERAKVL